MNAIANDRRGRTYGERQWIWAILDERLLDQLRDLRLQLADIVTQGREMDSTCPNLWAAESLLREVEWALDDERSADVMAAIVRLRRIRDRIRTPCSRSQQLRHDAGDVLRAMSLLAQEFARYRGAA